MWERIDRRRDRARRLRTGVPAALLLLALAAGAAVVTWGRHGSPGLPPPANLAPALALDAHVTGARATDGSVRAGTRWSLATDAAELRVFRNGIDAVARCPGTANCERVARGWRLVLAVDRPGTYQAVVFERTVPAPAPDLASLVAAARAAGVQTRGSDALVVY